MQLQQVKNILEALLLSADKPMDLRHLEKLFEADEEDRPSKEQLMDALQALQQDYRDRAMDLTEVSSGYRIQVREDYAGWVGRLWEEKVPRYSRALLETLVLIAYRQPITRGEIEEIRGVSVSSQIMKTLQEREWVRVLGHKDVPGKPSMYGTTSSFLDYFNLKTLDELPPLSDIKDLDQLHPSLQLDEEKTAKQQGESELNIAAEVEAADESMLDETLEQEQQQQPAEQDREHEAVEDNDQVKDEILEPQASQSPELETQFDTLSESDASESHSDRVETGVDPKTEPAIIEFESNDDDSPDDVDSTPAMAADEFDESNVLSADDGQPPASDYTDAKSDDQERERFEQASPGEQPIEAEVAINDPEAIETLNSEAVSETELVTDELPKVDDGVQEPEFDDAPEDLDEEPVKDEQAWLQEPSTSSDPAETEVDEIAAEPDKDSQTGHRGWTKLAQMLWERLKKLMQKGRKRTEPELNLDAQWA